MVWHAVWTAGGLCLWAEHAGAFARRESFAAPPAASTPPHPFAAPHEQLLDHSRLWRGLEHTTLSADLALPAVESPHAHLPAPSPALALAVGSPATDDAPLTLQPFTVPVVRVPPLHAPALLQRLTDAADEPPDHPGASLEGDAHAAVIADDARFFAVAVRLVLSTLAQQRFVPVTRPAPEGDTVAAWQPWLSDEPTAQRLALLIASMPAAARASIDTLRHEPWAIVEDLACRVADAWCRRALAADDFASAIDGRDPARDIPVSLMSGLLTADTRVPGTPAAQQEVSRRVRHWVALLEDRGASSAWRLLLRLNEPVILPGSSQRDEEQPWSISFHLQSLDQPDLIVDAADLWAVPGSALTVAGKRIDQPQELLLGELGRAARIYRRLQASLDEPEAVDLTVTTRQAYEFLREFAPLLKEQGFAVHNPQWWESPLARLGARLRIESDQREPGAAPSQASAVAKPPSLGLAAIVRYRWEIALGDTTLSLDEFEQLAARKSPLVRVNGRWVEVRPEDVAAAIRFMREHPGGEMTVGDALRAAYATDTKHTGIPVVGLEVSGWASALINAEAAHASLTPVDPPLNFHGTLRPYQLRGLSWLAFLERMGLSMCLADDMGLGKTIQLLALLALERQPPTPADPPLAVRPTLLIVPMSVVGNWIHETKRFCPELRVLVHHGPERLAAERFLEHADRCDLAITTYALAHRDRDLLAKVPWGRLVLDEAQYIKNPLAKQAQAVRSIPADKRVALTGTPVENRLSELWSIVDFLNPGYLGAAASFRTRFSVPIERDKDRARAEQLRGLVRPFVLRRLKSDPNVVADLPEKVESKEHAALTPEQAELYETCVRRMLAEVERAEGIQRRGLVLAGLIRLKQICNHPAQMLKDWTPGAGKPPAPGRSGKCIRLLEMMDELLAEGDQALVFTQFRQMGEILAAILRHHLERDILFLHGGTTQTQRVQLVERFQRADGKSPIMIVSLKAGGVGLNLTAATHVFHFDRWWNPAVENQATDRAYRIGQTRTVQVHKFVVRGTLEERIDQMIEAKTELAEKIIGGGEAWLTELDATQLRDLLTLRNDAVLDEIDA